MKVYIADNNLNIFLTATSESLPSGYILVEDNTIEVLETGSSTFEVSIKAKEVDSGVLRGVECGDLLLKETSFNRNSSEIYSILSCEYDFLTSTLQIYAESAGVSLLNTEIEEYTSPSAQTVEQIAQVILIPVSGWTVVNHNVSGSHIFSWDGTSSVLDRLQSVAGYFDARVYFTFEIENNLITKRYVHFEKYENTSTKKMLYLGKEIGNIRIKKDATELVTGLRAEGATPEEIEEGKTQKPINLVQYNYEYTDEKGDLYRVETGSGILFNETMRKRYSTLVDPSGRVVRPYSYDTLSKEMLAGCTRAALQKISRPEITYDIDLNYIDENIQVGDEVSIISKKDNLHLEAQVTKIESSVTEDRVSAEVKMI